MFAIFLQFFLSFFLSFFFFFFLFFFFFVFRSTTVRCRPGFQYSIPPFPTVSGQCPPVFYSIIFKSSSTSPLHLSRGLPMFRVPSNAAVSLILYHGTWRRPRPQTPIFPFYYIQLPPLSKLSSGYTFLLAKLIVAQLLNMFCLHASNVQKSPALKPTPSAGSTLHFDISFLQNTILIISPNLYFTS